MLRLEILVFFGNRHDTPSTVGTISDGSKGSTFSDTYRTTMLCSAVASRAGLKALPTSPNSSSALCADERRKVLNWQVVGMQQPSTKISPERRKGPWVECRISGVIGETN